MRVPVEDGHRDALRGVGTDRPSGFRLGAPEEPSGLRGGEPECGQPCNSCDGRSGRDTGPSGARGDARRSGAREADHETCAGRKVVRFDGITAYLLAGDCAQPPQR